MRVILSTAYWPNLHQFYYFLNSDEIHIEAHDSFQKQSYRNRCVILSANGPLNLSIPVRRSASDTDMLISYTGGWQRVHWGAITSAYQNSPYFEFFADEIRGFYDNQSFSCLREYNRAQLHCIYKILKLPVNFKDTLSYEKDPDHVIDLRELIHPKKNYTDDPRVIDTLRTSYYQTFSGKFPFVENLSVLDLLFNTGLHAKDYLRELPIS